jgi:hypothetical protein
MPNRVKSHVGSRGGGHPFPGLGRRLGPLGSAGGGGPGRGPAFGGPWGGGSSGPRSRSSGRIRGWDLRRARGRRGPLGLRPRDFSNLASRPPSVGAESHADRRYVHRSVKVALSVTQTCGRGLSNEKAVGASSAPDCSQGRGGRAPISGE